MSDSTVLLGRLNPKPDGESPLVHRSAVVTAANADGTLVVDLSGVSVTVSALAGSVIAVGDTVHLAAWAGDLLALGRSRSAVPEVAQGVIPSTVDVGSGSASVAADGTVTFAGVSSVSLNDIFDGLGADVYRAYIYAVGSVKQSQYLRLRNAGVNTAGTSYNRVNILTYSSAGPSRGFSFATSEYVYLYGSFHASAVPTCVAELTFANPNNGQFTSSFIVATTGASDRYVWQEYGQSSVANHDGFSLIASTGTMTGTIKVVKIA